MCLAAAHGLLVGVHAQRACVVSAANAQSRPYTTADTITCSSCVDTCGCQQLGHVAPCNLHGAEKCWPLAKCLLVLGSKVAKWLVGLQGSELVLKMCQCLALASYSKRAMPKALKLSFEGLLPCWGNF